MLRAIVALVGALALSAVPALAASADDAPVGTVSVTVTDGVGGPALPGMYINLMGSSLSGTSDANGHFTFTGVPNSWYSVNVGDPLGGFMNTETDHFEITDGAPDATETVALVRFPTGTGVVSGRLVDRVTHAPVTGVSVQIGGEVTRLINVTTGGDGTFSFSGLATDTDFVSAYAVGYSSINLTVPVDGDVTNLGDIQLAPHDATVVGRVVDPDGNGVPNMLLEFQPVDPTSGTNGIDAETDSGGYYTTNWNGSPAMSAGSYTLYTGLHGTPWAAASAPVTALSGQSVTANVTLQLRLSGSVSGRVVDDQGTPVQGICVYALDAGTRVSDNGNPITDENGNWSFSDLTTGNYIFRFRSCESAITYGAEYLGGSTPADATVVTVTSASDTFADDVVMSAQATISGHVDLVTPTGSAALPSDRLAEVDIYQHSGSQWVLFDPDYSFDTLGTRGDFTYGGLPAGQYRVEFSDQTVGKRAYATQYWSQSAAAGSATIDGASTITVASGGSRSGVDAHLSTVRPSDVPEPITTDALASGDQKTLTDSNTVAPGQHVTLSLGAEHAGEWVSVWGHSTPTLLADWVEVSADGTVQVTVPTTFPSGAHRLVAQTADGTVIGWEPFTVSDSAVVAPPTDSTVSLPAAALAVSTPAASSTSAGSSSAVTAAAPTPSVTAGSSADSKADASADSTADSTAEASSGSGHKATSPVVSPASGGLPIWLLVLIVGLGALIVASVIIGLARRVRV